MRTHSNRSERGQAYTLEAVVGSLIILTAVLFALQSIIITPTTSGAVDPAVREELRDQADDILVIAAQNQTFGLSDQIRYWDQSSRTFYDAANPRIGYGSDEPPGAFGTMLNETFRNRSRQYNVHLRYQGRNVSDGPGTIPLVDRGEPSPGAVVASYRVTLYDNQSYSSDVPSNAELWEYDTNATDNDDGYYPIPDAMDGPIYNIVEVRVTVW